MDFLRARSDLLMVSVVNWIRDKKGSIAIQSLFVIAIFVVIVYMGVQIWKVVSIKQTLHAATYQAAKYIALNGLNWGISENKWEEKVWPFIVAELLNNPYVPADSIRAVSRDPNPEVTVFNLNPECNMQTRCKKCQFSIKVQFEYDVLIPPRFGQDSSTSLRLNFMPTVHGFKLECSTTGG